MDFTGQFWQLTDLHWDQHYSTDGDPGGMCHANEDWKKLTSSKRESPDYISAGQYGMYSCDAPWDLIEFSIRGMAENSAVPDFIIWTGYKKVFRFHNNSDDSTVTCFAGIILHTLKTLNPTGQWSSHLSVMSATQSGTTFLIPVSLFPILL